MEETSLEAILGPDTCRLCLKVGRSPTPVSNEKLEGSTMAIKIDILTSVKVAPSDKVCPMCRINVRNFYDFRIMCLQSDARIKTWLARGEPANLYSFPQRANQSVRIYKRVRKQNPPATMKTLIEPSILGKRDCQSESIISSLKEKRLNQMVCVRPERSLRKDSENTINVSRLPAEPKMEPIVEIHTEMQVDPEYKDVDDDESDKDLEEIKEESNISQIKKELEDYETVTGDMSTEDGEDITTKEVKTEESNNNDGSNDEASSGKASKGDGSNSDGIHPVRVKTETLTEAEFEVEPDERDPIYVDETDFHEVKEEPVDIDDSENLEVLVDPLLVVEDGAESEPRRHEISLSPVLGDDGDPNRKNGRVAFPVLNGALSDEQRALDFVRKHLRKDRTPLLPPSVSPPPPGFESLEKPFKCTSCSGSFAYYKSFVKHRNRHSGIDTPYECPHCPESFTSNMDMHVHFRKHAETQFYCDKCYRAFSSQEHLDSHCFLHTGNKPYMCDCCGKTFPFKSNFALHMRKEHDEEISVGSLFRCHRCPTEWNSTLELKEHILEIHEVDTSDPGSSCDICSMKFLSKAILNVHTRVHQGLKPFK